MSSLQREEFRVAGLPQPVSHYTDVVRSGDLAFISGMIAIGADGHVIGEGDVTKQAEVVHDYLALALVAVGSSFADILKVTVFLTNIEDRHAVNQVRQRYFGRSRPASTLVQITALVVPEAVVEIEAVASIPHRFN
ncbi:MAG: RidA family protein [Mycobacterium sp.]